MKALSGLALGLALAWAASTTLPARAGEASEAAAAAPRSVDMPDQGAVIPLSQTEAHPMVQVAIEGQSFTFLVETGAWFNSISADAARRLRLPVSHGQAHLDAVSLGPVVLHDMQARVVRDQPGEVDGQLGLPAFAELLATMDFPHHQLRLARGALPEPDGRQVLQLEAIGPLWGVPMLVGGKTFTALFDTQSGDGFAIAPPLARQVSFVGKPVETGRVRGPAVGDAAVRTARLDGDIQLGSYRFARPIVSSFPVELRFQKLGVWLGPQLLQNFEVTLDQKNRRVRFVHVKGEPLVAAPPPLGDFGFRVARDPDGLVRVDAVKPGGDADLAGVAEGDELVTFDQKPAASWTEGAWRELYGHDTPVRFTVRHGASERQLEVLATILVP